jgi:hypothetical protein
LCGECLLKHVIEGKIRGKRKRQRRRKRLLADIKKRRIYLNFKTKALYHILWITHSARACGLVAGQTYAADASADIPALSLLHII